MRLQRRQRSGRSQRIRSFKCVGSRSLPSPGTSRRFRGSISLQAKWQTYRCKDNGSVSVRYFKTEDGAAAQVRFKGAEFVAPFSPEMSNEDLNAFSDGQYTWTIGNFTETDFYKEDGGFLVHHEASEETPDNMTDNLLLQECAPSQ